MAASRTLLAVLWQWAEGSPHAGARFWGCHDLESDGRIRDWPKGPLGLIPLGAAKVTVVEGEGLDLLRQHPDFQENR